MVKAAMEIRRFETAFMLSRLGTAFSVLAMHPLLEFTIARHEYALPIGYPWA